jgi:hypothetical protein
MTYSSAANSTNASASFAFSYGSGTELSSSHSSSTNNAGGANIWSYVSGNRYFPFAQGAVSLADGHYFGVWACSTGSSGAALATLAALGIQDGVSNQGAIASLGTVSNQFLVHSPLGGIVSFTQTNTAMPDSIATANIVTSGAAQFTRYPYFVLGSF